MAIEHGRADADWLALREPADAAARSPELVEALRSHLPRDGMVVHDLGCGTGSMTRWLAPRLSGPQRWVLHDRDEELLERASLSEHLAADGAAVMVETRLGDITRLDAGELSGASLITASALLDMFTDDELHRFVTLCAAAGCPVLVTLSVVGRVDLAPVHPLDRQVMAAFNAHQTRPTAAGRILGPDAAGAAAAAFAHLGLEVLVRPSVWRLGPRHPGLATQWLTGWVDAASEQSPDLVEEARAYRARRQTEVLEGLLSVRVHHEDLLALPPG